ncbi:sialidase family protein [Sedimentisphaera salicampi]|uniref:sialidase family protein n=1 Tax=Sedimentisphaera salicampi TaxID=1941349 RepID=UPI000B9CB702|nr:sialidase family protein [Sedimentisphaera salicampi]OXU15020.1 hypothetical protein SMSP1_01213 [Sedimentisphaera salicampi]
MKKAALLVLTAAAMVWAVPGTVVHHKKADSGVYVGSPGIAVLQNGDYIAKCDNFGPKAVPQTLVFRSKNQGKTWQKISEAPCYWANIFVHSGSLYMMGTSRPHGDVVILRSDDGGDNWTAPEDENSGLLLTGGKYHTAPVPVIYSHGRIWRGFEDAMGIGGWGDHFRAFMLSAPNGSNLLDASNWRVSNRIGADQDWLGGNFGGWLEGNAVAGPDNNILNILRVDTDDRRLGRAAIAECGWNGRKLTFDPESGFINMPGGGKKFTIRYDSETESYWTISNAVMPANTHESKNNERVRNAAALLSSKNLRDWQMKCVLLYHKDDKKHGFQYLDWLIEGDDIIAVSRTAFDDAYSGADNQHNANYLTFHRFEDFRELEMEDSADGARPGEYAWAGKDWKKWPNLTAPENPAKPPRESLKSITNIDVPAGEALWITTYVKIPVDWQDKKVWVFAGKIDDVDDTYINGLKVGSTGRGQQAWDVRRVYAVPKGALLAGKWNKVSIRIANNDGAGGLEETPSLYTIEQEIKLTGKWKSSDIDDTANAASQYYSDIKAEAEQYMENVVSEREISAISY